MRKDVSNSRINELASKHLGSAGSYAITTDEYDSSLLVPMPRKEARDDWNIKGDEFVGFDTWHCHEATFLLDNGAPLAGTLKLSYPSNSEFMVESKSIKLYLNTFDMCKMGESIVSAIESYENVITNDLSQILGCEVKVSFHPSMDNVPGYTTDHINLEHVLNVASIKVDDYKAKESHFRTVPSEGGLFQSHSIKVFTNVLRSRCRHTKQKDTGSAYITINTHKGNTVDLESLYKLIVSLREVDEFHEFCSEKLYVEIMKDAGVESCCVTLLYARRGSLDINPTRATREDMLPELLGNTELYTPKVQCQ